MKTRFLHFTTNYGIKALIMSLALYSFTVNGQSESSNSNERALTCGTTISSYPYSESFESGIGSWTQETSDDFDWTQNSGGTGSTGTGPSAASAGSFYMYTESSSPNYPAKVATFISPCFDLTSVSSPNFAFDYHMYGGTMGTLDLQASTDGTTWTSIWSLSGDQGDAWFSVGADLSAYTSTTVQLKFIATTAASYTSDFAIDKIVVSGTTPCSGGITSFPYTEGFESGYGLWSEGGGDDFDWIIRSGSTPSSNTGPSSAQEGSDYIYVEASNPNNPNKITYLNGPCIDLTSATAASFSFYYHMYGAASAGSLDLQVSTSSGVFWTSVWSLTGNQGNSWQNATVDLSAYDGSSINLRFVGTTGSTWQSDMAIDNMSFTVASNSAPTAVADNASTGSAPIIINVLDNDSDINGDNITLTAVTVGPSNGGTATINNNGTPANPADDFIDYAPSGAFAGIETFTYQICDDGSPSLCATAVVSVTVSPNFPPAAVADGASTINKPITIDVLANDTDPNPSDQLTITAITVGPSNGGTATINNNGTPANPTDDFINYAPSGSYFGTETFTYQICDNGSPSLCATAVVTVTIFPNTAPIATTDNASTLNNPISINVLSNDSDPNGDAITLTAITVAPNNGGSAIINNNGTIADPSDDYIDYIPSGSFFGIETFTYQICDDGAPNLCSTTTVSVTVNPNSAPNAVADNVSTSISAGAININVLGNDSDPDVGQTITLTSILVGPSNGGTAVINNNGTPGNPADDYIVYAPSGSYVGVETFTYQICDNGTPNLCSTATVNVNISSCPDASFAEPSPNWAFAAYWKYDDSGADLGTTWRTASYADACWPWARANLGFGDTHTTTITNHGGITYYFRKHFTVLDVTKVNYLLLGLVRDDGASVYINGTEVFRSNLPNGVINNGTLASSVSGGADETAIHEIIVPASLLVNGNNVIAVEVHQINLTSSDVNFDLSMSADMVDHTGDIYIAQNQYWNYNDNGIDLATSWRNPMYRENENEWEAGNAELGYGDGDEVTVVSDGGDPSNVNPTTYFRHYFTAYDIATYDTLLVKLRRDDGAVVYLNGQEVFRSAMAPGAVSYGTYSNVTASGADESAFFEKKFLASMINEGTNVLTVEVHQINASSSDVSFELELTKIDGDPNNYVLSYETITGTVFLDLDVDRSLSSGDYGQGALEVASYFDRDQDGNIDLDRDPRLFSYLTNTDGTYELDAYHSEIQSVKSDVSASNEDAGENGLGGSMSLTATKHKSLVTFTAPNLMFDTLSTWKYYDSGDVGTTSWINLGYDDSGWSSGTADFGFGDPNITTVMNSGHDTYYFRKQFTGGIGAGTYNTIRMKVKRDDGVVIYLNGSEIARNNMPEGLIEYDTYATDVVGDQDEYLFYTIVVSGINLNVGNNVIAVELHQVNGSSSDTRFDMMASAEATAITDIGYRFDNIDVPKGALIIDAFLRITSATISEDIQTIHIEGQASDNAPAFSTTAFDISSRARTTATKNFTGTHKLLDGREVKVGGIKEIIQEIVDRSGWNEGNAMALILSGFETEFYSIDGGYAPELTISYLDTTVTSAQYLVGIQENDLPVEFTYMTDPSPAVSVGRSFRPAANVNIGYLGTTSMCVASSDDGYDGLHIINRFSGKNKYIGPFGGAREIEAIAFNANADSLFAVDGDEFGIINTLTGAFVGYGNVIGTGSGADGNHDFNDVDGLAYDLDLNILWAAERRPPPTHDLIFVIDIATGTFIPDAFGPGVDYVVATGGGLLPDLDDIAVNPNTGNIFAMNNDNGAITNLVEIDISTGLPNVINPTGLNDMEGQGFHNDGLFYSTSGRIGIPDNAFYRVDTSNSSLHLVGYFESEGDFEGCDCKSGPFVSMLEGTVFEDYNADGILDDEDLVDPGVMVYLFEDLDGDSVISAGDILIDSFETDAFGAFFFALDRKGTFLINVNYSDLPPNVGFTTPEQQEARLTANGNFDRGNDFGYVRGLLPVELLTFYGENDQNINRLYWKTATETNNSHFDVLKSADAINFTKIGTVNGAGNTNSAKDYNFDDESPFNGINYYQLRQVDFDGTQDYSDIISLTNENSRNAIDVNIWPNPTKDDLNLSGLLKLSGELVTIEIIDIFGSVRIQSEMEVSLDNAIINLDELSSGYYIMKFTSNGVSVSHPFVKQ